MLQAEIITNIFKAILRSELNHKFCMSYSNIIKESQIINIKIINFNILYYLYNLFIIINIIFIILLNFNNKNIKICFHLIKLYHYNFQHILNQYLAPFAV